ncbi:TPA: GNAT family N-acetyltransferase [Candidatus Gastranaerophilales bacterium HUM_5]|nr:MAG TPA: GNAT family N-acetyltransferase [Candidatus Gastranaerophilales bacterium HUM_4]DAA89311.1 MAG TPA: GNAT family N-acetyltransferase [Candidatus Gastranaerophilales bacterium HUM_5]
MEFLEVKKNEIKELADLASEIWHEYWPCILTDEQIDYMVEKFQSESALEFQMKNENYSYYFIIKDGIKCGYFGISRCKDYLFLSKLYLKKEFRHRGIGRAAFDKIKELAKNFGYSSIRLTVNKNNKKTINAYLKYRFAIIDKAVTDIGNGFVMDDYIMSYTI